jgi:hypothetical protein
LQQGILPNAAPVGYLDCGAGKPKAIDPVKGHLVAKLFELYATGGYSLRELAAEAERLGLRNRSGRAYSFQQIDDMLRNPFYMGVIRSQRYGLFPGKHEPLVTAALFRRVLTVLSGKYARRTRRFTFLFRRLIRCRTCGRSLSGSERKGRVYYRCPTISCPTTSLREDAIEAAVGDVLDAITLSQEDAAFLEEELGRSFTEERTLREAKRAALQEAFAAANARLSRLTDLLLDGKIDAAAHDEKRASLVIERQSLTQEIAALETNETNHRAMAAKMFELLKTAEMLYETGDAAKKRQLLEIVISNCIASGKSLEFTLHEPFATLAKRESVKCGGQFYDTDRTFLIEALISWAWSSSHVSPSLLQLTSLEELVKPAA